MDDQRDHQEEAANAADVAQEFAAEAQAHGVDEAHRAAVLANAEYIAARAQAAPGIFAQDEDNDPRSLSGDVVEELLPTPREVEVVNRLETMAFGNDGEVPERIDGGPDPAGPDPLDPETPVTDLAMPDPSALSQEQIDRLASPDHRPLKLELRDPFGQVIHTAIIDEGAQMGDVGGAFSLGAQMEVRNVEAVAGPIEPAPAEGESRASFVVPGMDERAPYYFTLSRVVG